MKTTARNIRPWPLRLLLGVPTVLAGLLMWHAVARLAQVQRDLKDLSAEHSRLTREVEVLELKWTPEEAQALKARHDESLGGFLGGNQVVAAWLQQANDRTVGLALDVTPRFGTPLVRTIGGATVTLVPAQLEVRPLPGDGPVRTPYQRLLDLCLHLSTLTNRADLMELSVTASSNSLATATVSFSLWTKETTP